MSPLSNVRSLAATWPASNAARRCSNKCSRPIRGLSVRPPKKACSHEMRGSTAARSAVGARAVVHGSSGRGLSASRNMPTSTARSVRSSSQSIRSSAKGATSRRSRGRPRPSRLDRSREASLVSELVRSLLARRRIGDLHEADVLWAHIHLSYRDRCTGSRQPPRHAWAAGTRT
jgi:hypothetical protein